MKDILLKAMLVIAGFLCFNPAGAQVYEWTWMSGSKTVDATATASTPGNRDSQGYWQDAAGNFWTFGGLDYANNAYNDLWEYSPSNNQWTQVSGNTTSAGTPGARYGSVGLADAQGNFWIFGGAKASNCYNDLWEYLPATKTWNHISGSASPNATAVYSGSSPVPGARCYAAAAMDGNGNIWIFGGQDGNYNDYNDLWEYSISSGQWTFVSGGKNVTNSIGAYSGTSAAPGARLGHCLWIDAGQNIWLYGGQGYDDNAGDGAVFLNDLWEYSAGKWSWKGGNKSGVSKGVYGTMGIPSSNNVPGGRYGAGASMDASGTFWVFGGAGYDASGTLGVLNDLWSYSPASNQWTWVSGNNAVNQPPVFGTQGAAASTNQPGGLQNASVWVDGTGNIWVMGGSATGDYNDLWEFNMPAILPLAMLSLQGVCRGPNNYLTWQTIDEINTSGYIVERSPDGITFRDLGSRTAVGSGSNSYSFTDATPPAPGNNFYRLRILHTQGDVSYSRTIVLYNSVVANLSAYPNPTTSGIIVRSGSDALLNTLLKCYDAAGRMVRQQLITSREQYVDLQRLPAGIYLLQLADGATIRIMKE